MYGRDIIRSKKRRKTEQKLSTKIELNLSKGIKSKMRYSITLTKERNNINKFSPTNNALNTSSNNNNKKNYPLNKYSFFFSNKKNVSDKSDTKSYSKNDSKNSKRYSREAIQTKENKIKKDISGVHKNNVSNYQLNNIEYNIKRAINKMKNEIEKQAKYHNTECFSPIVIRNRLTSSPNLAIYVEKKKNKKKKRQSSFIIKEGYLNEYSFKRNFNKKKRTKSFDISEKAKKNLLLHLKNKIIKKSGKNHLTEIIKKKSLNDESNESDDNNENKNDFSFHPSSKFIFSFDLLLIIADLYTCIFIPLGIAQNIDIRERGPILREIIHYINDLIYLLDFIISCFRGYYNYEMEIIRNNKKIIIHYLKQYFVIDSLQAIPLYTLIRLFMKPNKLLYFGYSDFESIIISFLLFIKPFKIFKIIKKKQNMALEDFYSYLSENYYLEQLVKFLIIFLSFILFIHLFICLHIYFAFQSYPNWIVHTNIINESFSAKYITSLYFMITTMTTVGYGDIVCISFIERIYHIILLVLGTILYTFLVSKIGNYLRDESHEQIKLNKDLNILENIRITYPTMPFKLYTKIKNHLLSIFNKRKKTGISLLINGVPDAIKNDLLFKIYSKIINGLTIFKDVKNSNFIFQVLTSFIPIISKKEEIIILEGEIIQNIAFVKDGRLSLEIALNLNDPSKSIQKYLEMDYIGISKLENIKINNLNKSNSTINIKEVDYNDLKTRIDNILLDNQNKLVNNSKIDDNGISVDLGRLDFSRNDINKVDNENYHIIKIIDIRKNEHFGDAHLDNPSPFTLKVKSRIAELLLLRKHDIIIISNNYPNIWRRIQSKSYHNLLSLKKLTFKILKRYYNSYIYNKNKNNKDTSLCYNLDNTKNSGIDNDKPSFLKSLKTLYKKNTNNNYNNNSNMSNVLDNLKLNSTKSNNNIINKNKLYIRQNRKISGDAFSNDLNYSYNSFDLKPYYDSNKNNININENKKETLSNSEKKIEENDKFNIISPYNKSPLSCFNKKNKNKAYDNFTFYNNEKNKFNIFSPKKKFSIKEPNIEFTKFKTYFQRNTHLDNIVYNSKRQTLKNLKYKLSDFETISKYTHKITQKISIDNDKDSKFLTLEDINQNFAKRIKKQLKKRKKIRKLKQLLRLQNLKINKNIIEYYSKQNSVKMKNQNNINKDKNLSYSYSSSNYKIFSKIFDSSTDKGDSSSTVNNPYFESQSLKIIISESFEIKASYQNINSLSNGKIIRNEKYKTIIENKIKKYLNKTFMDNEDNSRLDISSTFNKIKKNNNNKKYYKYPDTEIKKNNDNKFMSEKNLTSISKKKYKNLILEETYKSSNKNVNIKTENTTEKFYCSTRDQKTNPKIHNSSKFYEKDLGNYSKLKKIESIKNEKIDFNNYIKSNTSKWNKDVNKIKKDNNVKIEQNVNINTSNFDINDKSVKNTFSVLKEFGNNNCYIINDNKLSILNNSCIKVIQKNAYNNEKSTKCNIF